MEGLQRCFLKELSVIAVPTNCNQLNSGAAECAAPQICSIHLPVLQHGSMQHSPHCKELLPCMPIWVPLAFLSSADFPVLWPGIFKPRQVINEFHSDSLQALLIMWPKAMKKAIGELSTSQVWHQHFGLGRAAVKELQGFLKQVGTGDYKELSPSINASTFVYVCSSRSKEHLPKWEPNVSGAYISGWTRLWALDWAVGVPARSRELDQMALKGPFQPKWFCDSKWLCLWPRRHCLAAALRLQSSSRVASNLLVLLVLVESHWSLHLPEAQCYWEQPAVLSLLCTTTGRGGCVCHYNEQQCGKLGRGCSVLNW